MAELEIFEEYPFSRNLQRYKKQFHGTQDEDKQEEIRMNLVKRKGFYIEHYTPIFSLEMDFF